MKIKTQGYFPFVITAETKKSQAGNTYLNIGIGQSVKGQDGNYTTTWLNTIEKRDLLVLANTCERAYHMIISEEAKEHANNQAQASQQPAQQQSTQTADEDSIPF